MTWSVDDSSLVRLRPPPARNPLEFSSLEPMAYLVAVREGRTTIRADLPPSSSDTIPARPPERNLVRHVVAAPRTVRVEISPRPDSIAVGELVTFRTRVFAAAGHAIPGAPVEIVYSDGANRYARTVSDSTRLVYAHVGSSTIVARFGNVADTLNVRVVPRQQR